MAIENDDEFGAGAMGLGTPGDDAFGEQPSAPAAPQVIKLDVPPWEAFGQPAKQPTRRASTGFHPDVDLAIDDAASTYGLDGNLMRAIAHIESSGDPRKQTGRYKGLFMLSDDEFSGSGGSGDIFDPTENARAAALKIKTEAAAFEKRNGRPPTPSEIYLLRQQGEGGTAAHSRNPDAPAWENMYGTREGREKGPAWAKQAIWGNLPDSEKRRFGSVENVTSRDFMDVWDRRLRSRMGDDQPVQVAQAPSVIKLDVPPWEAFGQKNNGLPPPLNPMTPERRRAEEAETRDVVANPSYEKLVQYQAQKEGIEAEIRQIRREMEAAPANQKQQYLLRLEDAGQRWKKAAELENFSRPTGMLDFLGGNLTPEESKAEVESRLKEIPGRIKEQEQLLADLKAYNANKLTDPDRLAKVREHLRVYGIWKTGSDPLDKQVIDNAEKALKESKQEAKELEDIQKGLRPGFKLSTTRSAVENVAQGMMNTVAALLKFSGAAAGYIGRPYGWSDPETNSLVHVGEWIEDLAKTAYPGDAARQKDFSQKLAQGAGSMIGFMGAGRLAGLLGGGAWTQTATTALTGGASQASETFDDATAAARQVRRLKDKDTGKPILYTPEEEDRLIASGWGFMLGLTEAIPIERALKRPSGSSLRQIFEAGGVGAIEEGLQEFGQSVGSNIVAKNYYDPTREVFEGAGEATLVGSILGFKMGAGHATLQAWKGRHEEAESEPEHQRIDGALQTYLEGALRRGEIGEPDVEKMRDEIKATRPETLKSFDAVISDWRRGVGNFQPTTTDAQPDNLETPGAVLASARTGRTTPPSLPTETQQQPEQPAAPEAPLVPPTIDEESVLKRMGYTPADIREMAPEQRQAELADAASRGILPETGGKPRATPPPVPQLAPDRPTAEPAQDIIAQTRDLVDPKNPRQGVYLSRDNLDALGQDDAALEEIARIADSAQGEIIQDIDGQGGMLLAKTPEVAAQIREALANGDPLQTVLGRVTGAGQGKDPRASAVVQQVTPEGAVTRESAVRPDQIDATREAFAAPGRDTRVFSPEEVLARREAGRTTPPPLPGEQTGDGSRQAPVKVQAPEDVARAAERVAAPTEAQKEAGNYAKGHIKFQGLDVTIENPKGSVRSGTSPDGTAWQVTMPAHYGYVKRTEGRDGDQVDVYIGENPASERVFVVDQVDPDSGKFDEHKAFLGYNIISGVRFDYDKAFSDGRAGERFGGHAEMTMDQFKDWLAKGKRTRPVSKLDKKPDTVAAQPTETPQEQPDNQPDTYEGEPLTADDIENAVDAWRMLTTIDQQLAAGRNVPDAKLEEANITSAEFVDALGREHDEFDSEQSLREYLGGPVQEGEGRPESRGGSQPEGRDTGSQAPAAEGSGRTRGEEAPVVQRDEADGGREGARAGDGDAQVARRYDNPPLSADEIDTLVEMWKYMRDVAARGKPQSLAAFVIDQGGVRDDGREVRHIAGSAKERPGLINKNGANLDDMALTAWQSGFMGTLNERPTIAEFLDALQDDLHTGMVVRTGDETWLEDIAAANEIARELGDYGVTLKRFRSEESLRRYFGQESTRDAGEAAADQGDQAPAEERTGATRPDQPQVDEPPFEGESTSAWLADREQRIRESKAAGNKHLDDLPRAVEGMRGVAFHNVHDPKERGVVRTVANSGDVVVNWSDKYSADKNLVDSQVQDGKNKVWQSWLMPTDLRDYVVDRSESQAATAADMAAVENWWRRELTPAGRSVAVQDAGLKPRVAKVAWQHLSADEKAALARAYGDLYQPSRTAAQPKTRGADQLADYTGVEIDGYAGQEPGSEKDGSLKRAFLADARNYLVKVAKALDGRGFKPYPDKKGKPDKPVSVNPAGLAVSGEVSLNVVDKDGNGIFAQISGAITGLDGGIALMARRARAGNRSGGVGQNHWLSVDLTVAELADRLEKIARPATKPAEPASVDATGQTSLVPEATTKEKIAAAERAKANRGKDKADADAGELFNPDAGKQTDLVEMAKAPKAEESPADDYSGPRNEWSETRDRLGMIRHDANGDVAGSILFDSIRQKRDPKTAWVALDADGNVLGYERTAGDAKDIVEAHLSKSAKTDPLVAIGDKILDEGFKTIVEARKFAQSVGIQGDNKALDEAIETAIVGTASRLAQNKATPPANVFRMLVGLYNKQPNLGTRTGTSVANQAYSTPVPLAYLASRLAGVANADSVYEPTAGNGALLLEVVAKGKAVVNELDPRRAASLRAQGFTVTENDGAVPPKAKDIDAVIMNPPFGAVKEGGKSKVFEVGDWTTTQIDHAVALNGLEAMADDGKAVLILGGTKSENIAERRKDYRGKAKREFYYRLYSQYNVVDHFTVSGDLYSKQGASWPVDVIVIDGRGKSERALPAANPPVILQTWDQLAEKLPDATRRDELASGPVDKPSRATAESGTQAAGRDAAREPDADRGKSEPAQPKAEGEPGAVRADRDPGQPRNVGNRERDVAAEPRDDRDARGSDQPARPQPIRPRVNEWVVIDTQTNEIIYRFETQTEARDWATVHNNDEYDGSGKRNRYMVQRDAVREILEPSPKPAEIRPRAKRERQEGAGQAAYEPASNATSLDTLIPINMADAARNAIERVAERHGSVDQFVADRLGYDVRSNAFAAAFSAEQIDALASAIDNVERGAAFIIGDQCVAGETRIHDPLTGKSERIDVLAARATPHAVLALTPSGFAAKAAIFTYKKGRADLFRVTLSDGRAIVVTQGHRFLTPDGWSSLSGGVGLGTYVAVARSEDTNSLATRGACALDGIGKPQDCLDRYCEDSHLGDEQLRKGASIDLVVAQLQDDALARILASSHTGGLAPSPARSLDAHNVSPRAKRNSALVVNHGHGEILDHAAACVGRSTGRSLQNERQSVLSYAGAPQEARVDAQHRPNAFGSGSMVDEGCRVSAVGSTASECESHEPQQGLPTPRHLDTLQLSHPSPAWLSVASVEFVRHDDFYDMYVPGPENYLAEGFINHNTGIGKGRIAAGMLRYAMKQGMVPVFVTEKPDLYGDMFRDLRDIGVPEMLGRDVRMFITNAGENVPLDEEAVEWKNEYEIAKANGEPLPKRRGQFLSGGTAQKVGNSMARITAGEDVADVVFTTYDQMNTVKGETTARRQFLSNIAPRAMYVFDESHTAGGAAKTGWEKKGATPNRADFARDLAARAKGVMFSSATYAKRPDVMDLYARTDMGKAVNDAKDLPELIQRGGVPMQQIVASMLSESGQYMRRERSFDGVEYALEPVPVDVKAYQQFSAAMQAIFRFDLAVEKFRKEWSNDALDSRGMAKAKDSGVGGGSANSTSFGALMHNITNQMLLAIKAEQTAQRAIKAHKAGEKPVIALANTNESFIKDFAENEGIEIGQPLDLDFSAVLERYLSRTLRVTLTHPDGKKKEYLQIPVDDLPTSLRQEFRAAQNIVREGSYESLPISPIDWIRYRLGEAGMSVKEVTGRQTMIDYSKTVPVYVQRPKAEQGASGKRGSIAYFNSGRLDALILNRSGSTGVSMHASEKFKDRRRRRMILAQAEGNIDTHLQMLGRVHRTGQVIPPAYSQIAAEIPAEARPTAVLMKKMASLNANTTGARSSAFTVDSVDFINEVGDKVVADILIEDADLNVMLGEPLMFDEKGAPKIEDVARKATGRLVLLDPDVQSKFLDQVQKAYLSEIEQLDALGENPLEAKTVDIQAKTLDTTELKPKQGDSPFLDAVRIEKVSAKAQGRALPPAEVATKVAEFLKVSKPEGAVPAGLASLEAQGRAWKDKELARVSALMREQIRTEVADTSADAKDSVRRRLEMQLQRWQDTMALAYPGARVTLGMPAGDLNGVVMSVERTGKAKQMTALGSWTVKIAVPDSMRVLEFPMSKLFPPSAPKSEDEKGATIVRASVSHNELVDQFEDARKEGRETRYVVTGNILGGYDQTRGRGRIVNFTTDDGKIRPGILMGREFEVDKFMETRRVRFQTGEQVATFLDRAPLAEVTSNAGEMLLGVYRGQYRIEMAGSKTKAGAFFTDRAVLGILAPRDFSKRGNKMIVEGLTRSQFTRAVDKLKEIGAAFETKSDQDTAQAIIGTGVDRAVNASGSRNPNAVAAVATMLKMGRATTIPKPVVETMLGEIRQHRDLLPKGVPAGVVSRIEPNREKGASYDAVAVITDTEGGEHRLPINWADLSVTRAFARIDGGLVGFLRLSPSELGAQALRSGTPLGRGASVGVREVAPGSEVGSDLGGSTGREVEVDGVNPAFAREIRALLAHESVHVRRRRGILRGALWARLVAHANNLRILDKEFGTYLREIGHPDADKQPGGVTIRDMYRESYALEADFQERMDQEAVAVMVELAEHGQLLPMEIEPIADDLRRAFRLASNGNTNSSTPGDMLFAIGRKPQENELRTNADGFILQLPFADKWGDPRFDAEDRMKALDAMRQIQSIDVRKADWSTLVQARDDLTEITAQLFYYKPDAQIEDIKNFGGGDVRAYAQESELGFGWTRPPDSERPDLFSGENIPPDLIDFATEGRAAIDHLLTARRRGVKELLAFDERDEPKGRPSPVRPDKIADKMPSGFYSLAARKLAEVPESHFNLGGKAVINYLTQAGVKRSEIEHFQLQEKFGKAERTTRAEFEQAIAERMFDFRRKSMWWNPERPTGGYGYGNTRAFDGPRIPGRGIYFERLMAFPKKLKGGEMFPPGYFESPHWSEKLKSAWASWRGSIREIDGWGRMVIGEEGQTDYMQGARERRPSIDSKDFVDHMKNAKAYDKVMDRAITIGHEVFGWIVEKQPARGLKDALIPGMRRQELPLGEWLAKLDEARAAIKARIGPDGRYVTDDTTISFDFRDEVKKSRLLDELEKLRRDHEEFFAPGSFMKYMDDLSDRTPTTPIDASYVRTMVRDLLLLAADKKADSIAISTSETTGRIQNNAMAAQFYDHGLKPALEKELRRQTGDGSIKLELVKLPKPMGAPRNEKPYTVWAVKLSKDVLSQIKEQGQPLFALGSGGALSEADADSQTGQSMRRDLDALGYYSKALEAARELKQAKGTPEQMLAQLKKAGVKDAEIAATNLNQFLEGKSSVTRDEIISHLEGNRVGVREVVHSPPDTEALDNVSQMYFGERFDALSRDQQRRVMNEVGGDNVGGSVKWQSYSLDPSNPTYRETVLHLPARYDALNSFHADMKAKYGVNEFDAMPLSPEERQRLAAIKAEIPKAAEFKSGHFPEPNIIGHMMTSMTRHEGKPVYTIDQIQSDWGQKLRDGGVRDEAKIAELKAKSEAAQKAENQDWPRRMRELKRDVANALGLHSLVEYAPTDNAFRTLAWDTKVPEDLRTQITDLYVEREALRDARRLADAEFQTANAATPGHPLVNTTDQWTTTTLRRAIRQAAEADAEYIAIPTGDTVLSYNPGDVNGMRQFYGSVNTETHIPGIVPKNLRKLLEKIDPAASKPTYTAKLETPTYGMKGEGFTLFPLTDKVKQAVLTEGQPMFALGGNPAPSANRRALVADIRAAVDIVQRVAGPGVDIDLRSVIDPRSIGVNERQLSTTEAAGLNTRTAGGYYLKRKMVDGRALIGLAVNDPSFDPRTSAGHEAWHHVEETLASDAERRLLRSPTEMQRMTRLAALEIGRDPDDPSVGRLLPSELRATAFQRYRREREEGLAGASRLHIGVRRFFDRMVRLFQSVRNALAGRGFDSFESVFERARTGQMVTADAERSLRQGRRANPAPGARNLIDPQMRPAGAVAREPFDLANVRLVDRRTEAVPLDRINTVQASISMRSAIRKLYDPSTSDGRLVSLFKYGDRYYVNDGNHRVAALRALRAPNVTAEVIEIAPRDGDAEVLADRGPADVPAQPVGAQEDRTGAQAALIPTAARVITRRWLDRLQPKLDNLRISLQDKAIGLRWQEEAIEAQSGTRLPEALQTYMAEAIYHGRAGERLVDLQKKTVDPLVEHLRRAKITFEQLGEYLYARHAVERNAAIRNIDPTNDAGSGMTDAEARGVVGALEQGPRGQAFRDAATMVDTMITDTRDLLYRAGLLTQEQYTNWSTTYQHYVPLRGFEADEETDGIPRVGRGLDIRGPESMQALGRRSKADNPAAYALQQAVQAIIRAEKNRVDKTLYRLIQAHPDPDVWRVFRGEAKRRINPTTGLVEMYWVPPAFAARNNENVFGVKIAGKQHYMEILHEPLRRALRSPDAGLMHGTAPGRALFKAARFYAQLVTSYNPEFVVSNYLRDIQTALMNVGDIANKPADLRRKMFAEALSFKSIRGAMAALQAHEGRTIVGTKRAADENMLGMKRSQAAQDYAKWFEEYRLAGGKISFIEMNDIDRIKTRIEKSVSEGRVMRGLRDVFQLVDNTNAAVENGVRLSVYKAMRENGVSQDRAAFIARELTVNFNRKGEWGPAINAFYLFFNASVQGTTRLAQAAIRSKTVRIGLASIFLAGAMLDVYNYLAAADDDDGENSYEKIKDWVKEKNMIVMLPGRKDFVQIPMPYGYNVFYLSGQKTAALTRSAAGYGKEKPAKAIAGLLGAVMESFSPLGAAPSGYQMALPTLLDPFSQIVENKNWFGGRIYPERSRNEKHKPDSELFYATAPAWAVDLARGLNALTGGTKARSGYVDVSPETIEHFVEFAGGGVAKFAANIWNTGDRAMQGKEWIPEKTPFVRRLYGKATTESRRRDFYEKWNEVDALHYQEQEYRKAGDQKALVELRREHPGELAAYNALHTASEQLSKLRKQSNTINLDRTLDKYQKEDRLKVIIESENRVILRALGTYNKIKKDREKQKEPTP